MYVYFGDATLGSAVPRPVAATVLEIGEVDAFQLPLQQLHQVGEAGRLRFFAGHQGELYCAAITRNTSFDVVENSIKDSRSRAIAFRGRPPIYPPVMPMVSPSLKRAQKTGSKLSEP